MKTIVTFMMVIAFAIVSVNAQEVKKPILNYTNPTSCGISDGSITLVEEGVSMNVYSIDNVLISSSIMVTGLNAGTYKVEIAQCNGNVVVDFFTLVSPSAPMMVIQANDIASKDETVISLAGSDNATTYSLYVNGEKVSEGPSSTWTLKKTKEGDVIMVEGTYYGCTGMNFLTVHKEK